MMYFIVGLALCVLAVFLLEWLLGESEEEKIRKQIHNDTIRAMHERMQLDNEMLRAMKAMSDEAQRHPSTYPQYLARRRQ